MELNVEFSGFRFTSGPDPERADRVLVSIFKDGEPFTDLHGRVINRSFSRKVSTASIEEFCRRFATDDAFRNELLVKQTMSCC
jgi:hypothetical protein